MTDNWVKLDFEYGIRHVGFNASFHDGDDAVELLPEDIEKYLKNKDTAQIFFQARDNESYSAAEMFSWFLKESEKSLEDFIMPQEAGKAFEQGETKYNVEFPINFTPESFYMETVTGRRYLKTLELGIEFNISPKLSS